VRHPLHPMFVHFPIGLWTTSLAWDALSWWSLSYWCLAAGLVMALPAIGTGLYEFMRIEQGHPAARIALWHMSAMSGAAVLFLASLLLRKPAAAPDSVAAVIALSLAGLACLVAGGFLASRLVYGHGVGMK
jgi:uncharacterized membrane protein